MSLLDAEHREWEVLVAGGGAAGLFAAIAAARQGARVAVLERNRRPGAKILASGGGRCNLTTTREGGDLLRSFPAEQRRFLSPALRTLPPARLRAWFEERGVALREEALEKVFPVAGRASVVLDALLGGVRSAGAAILPDFRVRAVEPGGDGGFLVRSEAHALRARRVVLAAGGESYPKAGTTGDGAALAASLGHPVTPRMPALAALRLRDPVPPLAGIVLDPVILHARVGGRRAASTDRPLLFTHEGVSGPGPMNLSREFAAAGGGEIEVELAPGASFAGLEKDWLAAVASRPGSSVLDSFPVPLPARLRAWLLQRLGIEPRTKLAALTRQARRSLADALAGLRLAVCGTAGFDRAEVTRGGVGLESVDPKTMESRICPGLYLCGELLDVDGPIGGFNFQAAFATGHLAGLHAGRSARQQDGCGGSVQRVPTGGFAPAAERRGAPSPRPDPGGRD